MMFINFSNHPSSGWSEEQKREAEKYGEIIDFRFPAVGADLDEDGIYSMALEYVSKVTELAPAGTPVMVQGEFTFTYILVRELTDRGYIPLAACSDRDTVESVDKDGNVTKVAVYKFVRFRRYNRENGLRKPENL